METGRDPERQNRSLKKALDHICAAFWEQIRLRAETAAALSSQKADAATPKHGTLEGTDEPPKQQQHSFERPEIKSGGRQGPQRKQRIRTLQRRRKRRPRNLTQKGCSTHRHGTPTSQGPAPRLNRLPITADGAAPHLPSWNTKRHKTPKEKFSSLNAIPAISLYPQARRLPHWNENLSDMRQDWLATPEGIG
ncbi:Hypothetical predicted protein [Pelobates cultripes]|uniref:Uncharacterized protein n=1 Tax=Pelobates cultripes TaxID=61616 RepID=A0AAD1WLJ4_PELCU|nr:Hypothetical predicted protein [Pelobates cultripes]